ncbi:hypothetical protein AYI69_g1365 [Smittium culicis]|uniref:Uncharacterized protein n=1 Tax=Smittium culicis TaxID=133412 RepID=A0A1R1YQG0_9FUNG|nr:hypothetical protein AYI69_g1365 [Smittium culicis]
MEQEAVTQVTMEQVQLKLLTDLVQQFLRERNNAPELEDPHVTTMAPVTDLIVIQDTPGIDTEEDVEIMLASTVRALLSVIATTVTRATINFLHKGIELPGKPTQFVEYHTKLLMNQEVLGALIAKKHAKRRQRVQPFRKRQNNTILKDTYSRKTAMAQSTNAATAAEASSNKTSDLQSNFRVRDCGRWRRSRYLFTIPKKTGGSPTSPRPPQAQPPRGGTEFQDGYTDFHLPYNPPKRLSHVAGSAGCIYAHSVPRLAIRAITEPIGIHQDSPSGSGMGQSEGDSNICIPRRSVDPGRGQASMRNHHVLNLFQTLGAYILGIFREVLSNAIPVNRISRNGSIDVDCSSFWETHVSPYLGAQEQSALHMEVMDIDCNSDESSNPEPEVLEEPTGVMEREVILARNTRARDLYRLQQHTMGNRFGSPLLLKGLEHTTEEDAHQCKRATVGTLCSETQEGCGKIGVSLFRKHNHILVHQEVWRHNLLRTIGDLRTVLATLPENQNPPQSIIRPVTPNPADAPSRLTAQTEWSLSQKTLEALNTQYGRHNVDLLASQQFRKLIQVQQLLLLPTQESDISGGSEITQRTNVNDTGYTDLEVNHLVSRSIGTVNISANHIQSNDCNPDPKSGKSPLLEKMYWCYRSWRISGVPSKHKVSEHKPSIL